MQEIKDPVNHLVNDPLHSRSDPTSVQLEGPEQETDQASVPVQMTLGLQGLELVMGMTQEQALVMLPPPEQSLCLAQEGWAHPPLAQALGLRRPHPLSNEKDGLLAKPPS